VYPITTNEGGHPEVNEQFIVAPQQKLGSYVPSQVYIFRVKTSDN